MARKETITLILTEGSLAGYACFSIGGWEGVIYKIPRTAYDTIHKNDDIKTGVYLLLWGDGSIYVGKGDVHQRLKVHSINKDKHDWEEVIIYTIINKGLSPSQLQFIEHKLWAMAKEICPDDKVKNDNTPDPGGPNEAEIITFNQNAEYIKIAMEVFGYNNFKPKNTAVSDDLFYCKVDKNKKATLLRTKWGYELLKGSYIKLDIKSSNNYRKLYRFLIDETNGILKGNIPFQKPSPAGTFVLGGSLNGNELWKNSYGKTLGEVLQNEQ